MSCCYLVTKPLDFGWRATIVSDRSICEEPGARIVLVRLRICKHRCCKDAVAIVAEMSAFKAGCLAMDGGDWERDEYLALAGEKSLRLPAWNQNDLYYRTR